MIFLDEMWDGIITIQSITSEFELTYLSFLIHEINTHSLKMHYTSLAAMKIDANKPG